MMSWKQLEGWKYIGEYDVVFDNFYIGCKRFMVYVDDKEDCGFDTYAIAKRYVIMLLKHKIPNKSILLCDTMFDKEDTRRYDIFRAEKK